MNHHIYHSHTARTHGHGNNRAPQRNYFGRSSRLPNSPGFRTWVSNSTSQNNNRMPVPPPIFIQNAESNMNQETYFRKSFQKFVSEYFRLEFWLFAIFFILLLFTQILNMEIGAVVIALQVTLGVYAVYLARRHAKTPRRSKNKVRIAHQIFKIAIFILFLYFLNNQGSGNTGNSILAILLAAIVLLNFFISTITIYVFNYSLINKLTYKVNQALLVAKLLIFIQGLLLLIQMCLGETILWPIVFIPGWLLIVLIFFLLIKAMQYLFISYRKIFWKSLNTEKIKGAIWILGNLIGAGTITLWALLSLTLSLHKASHLEDLEISILAFSIYVLIISAASIFYTQYFRKEIFHTAAEISMYFNTNKEDLYKVQEKMPESPEKKPEEPLKYQHVTRISSSYFKFIEENDVKKLLSNRNIFTRWFQKRIITKKEPKSSMSQESAEKNSATEANKCIICFDHNPDGVFMECGHSGICFECGKEMIKAKQECHMCRSHINILLRIDLNNSNSDLFKILSHIKTLHVEP